jgi:hypothetical protein
LQNPSDIARPRSAIDIDRGDTVAMPRMLREAGGELRLGATYGVHDQDVEAAGWQVFGDVEDVLADAAAGRLADEYDAECTLTTCHTGSVRAPRLIAPLTATITEYGTTYLATVLRRP